MLSDNVLPFGDENSRIYFRNFKKEFLKNSRFSISQLSRKLGYKSARSAGMFFDGQRLATDEFLSKFFVYFTIPELQKNYISLLVQRDRFNQRGRQPAETLDRQIENLRNLSRPKQVIKSRNVGELPSWTGLLAKQLLSHPRHAENSLGEQVKYIQKKLRKNISDDQIVAILSQMANVYHLRHNSKGGYKSGHAIRTADDLSDAQVRALHTQFISLGLESLKVDRILDREFQALTLQFDKSQKKEAKAFIRKFVSEFNDRFYSSEAEEVFQLNLQFFSLTKPNSQVDEFSEQLF